MDHGLSTVVSGSSWIDRTADAELPEWLAEATLSGERPLADGCPVSVTPGTLCTSRRVTARYATSTKITAVRAGATGPSPRLSPLTLLGLLIQPANEAPSGTPASTARRRSSARTELSAHGRPRVGPSMTQNSGPGGRAVRSAVQSANTDPAPVVHPDLAPAVTLPVPDQQAAAALEISLGERERLMDTKTRPPQHDDQAPIRRP